MSDRFAHPHSRRPGATARAAVLALAALCAGSPASGDVSLPPCPAAVVQLASYSGAGPFSVAGAAYDSTFVDTWTARVAFDRTEGRLSLSASSSGRMSASVRVVEAFDILGLPPGTAVAAVLEFRLDGLSGQDCGGSGCGLTFEGLLAAGPDSVAADASHMGPGNATRTLAATLYLPVTFVAGTPLLAEFLLRYSTGPGGGGAHAEGAGVYRVGGLPPGVRAVACPGGDLTPARIGSWGELKTRYR